MKTREPNKEQRRAADWKRFEEFCRSRRRGSLPATVETVRIFMGVLLEEGATPKDVSLSLDGIRDGHERAALPSPTKDVEVLRELEALMRPRAPVPPQAENGPLEVSRKVVFPSGTPGSGGKEVLPEVVPSGGTSPSTLVELLREVPEEELWLQGFPSANTRRNYRLDVRHFIRSLSIQSAEELRRVDRAAVIHWVRLMQQGDVEQDVAPDGPRTIRRRLSALSSLFSHLVEHRKADFNPVHDIKRPKVNRQHGVTRALSAKQARKVLDAPSADTLEGLRDRALLSVGLQIGARRAEIAGLKVKDFREDRGFWGLHFIKKGGEDLSVSAHPQTVQRIREYLGVAGHGEDLEGPLFRPMKKSRGKTDTRRHLHPEMVALVLKKYLTLTGVDPRAFAAHSMRATFITTALENGAKLEDVQRDVGHAHMSTTLLYDRRGHNPEKSASFFANY